jgi:hypothetical protein
MCNSELTGPRFVIKFRYGNQVMRTYRFYFLDRLAEPVSEQRLWASDDAEALEIARLLAHNFSIEVWQNDRRVGVVLMSGTAIAPDSAAAA